LPTRRTDPEDLSRVTDKLGYPIDPRILPICQELTDSGFYTISSCQGDSPSHPFKTYEEGSRNPAYIMLEADPDSLDSEDKKEIDQIIREFTNVPYTFGRIRSSKERGSPSHTDIMFSGPI